MASIADEYEPLEVIGKGSFGTVRKVRQKDNGAILVRKEIEYTSMNVQERNHIISELRILRELNHPHIVKYLRHDHVPEKKSIHIYQEYCDGGDLGHVIATFKKNKESVPEEFIWDVLVQTLLALHKCHYGVECQKVDLFSGSGNRSEPAIDSETVIIHRDIKPENIFLLDSRKTIKLGDFGLAKMLTSSNDFAKTYVGTPYYMSPEVLMDNPYSPVCDIWSLGCVLFELCNLQPPFQAKTHLQLQTRIRHGSIPEISAGYSQPLRNIISESITVDPEKRPTCHELLETISIKMFRKEMELRAFNDTLHDFQGQLAIKSRELKKRESVLQDERALKKDLESKRGTVELERERGELERQKADLERQRSAVKGELERQKSAMKTELERQKSAMKTEVERQKSAMKTEVERQVHALKVELERQMKHELELEYLALQKKAALQKEELEKELVEEFDVRKRIMDQEGKEMRLYYQREFKHVVEQGVQARLAEMLKERKGDGLVRKKSDSSSSSFEKRGKPKGPRELEALFQGIQSHQNYQISENSSPRRSPLRTRNTEPEIELYLVSPRPNTNHKKRITDEFERLHIQRRNTPEFEEQYMRHNRRYES